jgi:hypothetical protein
MQGSIPESKLLSGCVRRTKNNHAPLNRARIAPFASVLQTIGSQSMQSSPGVKEKAI